jgi:hypothetical protein
LTVNADGTFSYTPNQTNIFGDSFTYQVFDGLEYSTAVTVEIDVRVSAPGTGGPVVPVDPGDGDTDSGDQDPVDEGSEGEEGTDDPDVTPGNPVDPVGGSDNSGGTPTGPNTGGPLPIATENPNNVTEPERVDNGSFVSTTTSDNAFGSRGNDRDELRSQLRAWQGFEAPAVVLPNLDLPYAMLQAPGGLIHQLDTFERNLNESLRQELIFEKMVVGSAVVTGGSLTVGYVIWLIRSGSLLATMLSVIPSWTSFDPLPVLDRFEDDSEDYHDDLATLAQQGHKK